jgi:hypothetical protein
MASTISAWFVVHDEGHVDVGRMLDYGKVIKTKPDLRVCIFWMHRLDIRH